MHRSIEQQHVDGLLAQYGEQGVDGSTVGHIKCDAFDIAIQALQRVGAQGIAAGGNDTPAIGGILAGEFQAQTAIGAGDEYAWQS